MPRVRQDSEIGSLLAHAEVSKQCGDEQSFRSAIREVARRYQESAEHVSAAELFESNGLFDEAALAWLKSGRLRRAAQAHVAADEPLAAAELLVRCNEHGPAAKLLAENGDPLRASFQFEKAGDLQSAAEVLLEHIGEGNTSGLTPSEGTAACKRAGALLTQLGRIEDAVRALLVGGHWLDAARTLEGADRVSEAIDLLMSRGELLAAAELARRAGDHQRALLILATRAETAGKLVEAARHYEQADRPRKAAMLYEFAGDRERAAKAHERAGAFEAAAAIYQKLGRTKDAARCLDSVRTKYPQPALIRAAQRLIDRARKGKPNAYQEALELLEQADDRVKLAARSLGAKVLVERGDPRAAIDLLRNTLKEEVDSTATVDLLYQYGRLLEQEGRLAEARHVYRRLVVLDPRHRDVMERMQYIAGMSEADASYPPSGGLGAVIPHVHERPPTSSKTDVFEFTPTDSGVWNQIESGEYEAAEITSETYAANLPETGSYAAFREPESLIGTRLRGRFRIESLLGSGGDAQVYRGVDTARDRPVAIKVLDRVIGVGSDALERFINEARIAAEVDHPTCVPIYDFGRERGITFMAMEFVNGPSLSEFLESQPVTPRNAMRIASEVLDALAAIHQAGIIHGDVKPGNILIDEGGRARLTDFGIARREGAEGTPHGGLFTGTPKYMAPEQANGDTIDARADLYALGAVLFEMLAGKPAFDGSLASVAVRLTRPPPEIPKRTKLPDELRGYVKTMMARKPEKRPQSAKKILRELRKLTKLLP